MAAQMIARAGAGARNAWSRCAVARVASSARSVVARPSGAAVRVRTMCYFNDLVRVATRNCLP